MTTISLQMRTRYPVMGSPPSFDEADHSSSVPPSVAVAFSNVGGSGTVAGVTFTCSDGPPLPTVFVAETTIAYITPLVRPSSVMEVSAVVDSETMFGPRVTRTR